MASRTRGPLMSAAEVAGMLGVSTGTVERWADARRIPSVRTVEGALRFDRRQVTQALDASPNHPEARQVQDWMFRDFRATLDELKRTRGAS